MNENALVLKEEEYTYDNMIVEVTDIAIEGANRMFEFNSIALHVLLPVAGEYVPNEHVSH